MNLREAFPEEEKFRYLYAMQPRLDEAGHTVENFIDLLMISKPDKSGVFKAIQHMPNEIMWPRQSTEKSYGNCIIFLKAFGWAYIVNLIAEEYPSSH